MPDAEERYKEVRAVFEEVKSHYSGLLGRLRRNLPEEDNKTLDDCMGVLLPLGMEASVQDQIRQAPGIGFTDTLFYQIGVLEGQIMEYLANFRNTGVTRLQGSSLDW